MFMPNPFNRLQGNAMSQGTQKNTAEVWTALRSSSLTSVKKAYMQ
jgi:hypothetical protein